MSQPVPARVYVTFPDTTITVTVIVREDAFPDTAELNYVWTVKTGDTTYVNIENFDQSVTDVTIDKEGIYTLQIAVSDSVVMAPDIIIIVVELCICDSGMPIHKSKHYQTNDVEIAALCAPRPMMLISDGNDWTRNTPRIEYPYIQKVYVLYNAEHKVENVHFPAEKYNYGYSKRSVVYNFFTYHLKLNTRKISFDPTIKEDFVTILPEDQLRVYTKDNPIPDDAPKEKQVLKAGTPELYRLVYLGGCQNNQKWASNRVKNV